VGLIGLWWLAKIFYPNQSGGIGVGRNLGAWPVAGAEVQIIIWWRRPDRRAADRQT